MLPGELVVKAHKPIALDCAFVLEAFGRAHGNLSWQVVPLREHRGTDYRGVIRVDQWLPTHDDEDTAVELERIERLDNGAAWLSYRVRNGPAYSRGQGRT